VFLLPVGLLHLDPFNSIQDQVDFPVKEVFPHQTAFNSIQDQVISHHLDFAVNWAFNSIQDQG